MTAPKLVPSVVSSGMFSSGSTAINRMNGAPKAHCAGRDSAFHQPRKPSPTPPLGRCVE